MSSGPEQTTTETQKQKAKELSTVKASTDTAQGSTLSSTGQTTTQQQGTQATQQQGQTATQQQGSELSTMLGSAATQQQGTSQSDIYGSQTGQTSQQGQTSDIGQQATQQQGATTGLTETAGWQPAQGALLDVLAAGQKLGGEVMAGDPQSEAATQGLVNTAQTVAGFNPQIQQLAQDQLAGGGMGAGVQGINDAYGTAADAYRGIADGSMIGADNPYLNSILGNITDRTRNDVGSQFAAAGRSFSGAHADALGRAMSQGLAQPLFENYRYERDAQMGANRDWQNAALGRNTALDNSAGNVLNARTGAANTFKQMYDPYNQQLDALDQTGQIEQLGMLGNIATQIANTGGTQQQQGTSQQTGLSNTSNLGTSNMLGTSAQQNQQHGLTQDQSSGLTNTSQLGNTQTAQSGLTNTMLNGLVSTNQTGQTDTSNNVDQTGWSSTDSTQKTKGKTTGKSTGTATTTQESDPLMTGAGLLLGGAGMLLSPMPSATVGGSLLGMF
jgi:hypothetical protein